MKVVVGLLIATFVSVTTSMSAMASVIARVNLNDQEMRVYVDGKLRHSWAISSGRQGFETPTGNFRPQRLEREWYSSQYDDAPMPYSIFFRAGYAIHGGYGRVGQPASHGCIRLTTNNARKLFELVENKGPNSMRIEIED